MTKSPQIEDVEAFPVGGAAYVRVTTDSGMAGIGEATHFLWPEAVAEIVRGLRTSLVGQRAFDTEAIALALYRGASFRGMTVSGALAAIDQALWDIKGKVLDVPVWDLLGGSVRSRVPAILVLDEGTTDEIVDEAKRAASDGFRAVKVLLLQPEHHLMSHAARLRDLRERLAAIRAAVGDDIDIAVELHRNMGPDDSLALMRELAELRPVFVEDPIPPDSVSVMRELAQRAPVPIAAGERTSTTWEFAEYAAVPGIAFLRPDVGIAGGFTGFRRIAALAEARHLLIAPHAVPSGPVATVAHAHLGRAIPSFWAQEHRREAGTTLSTHVDHLARLVDGHLVPPDGPGLGVDLLLDAVRAAPGDSTLLPIAGRRADGSIAAR